MKKSYEFYPTPQRVIDLFLDHYSIADLSILDVGAGEGAIGIAVKAHVPSARIQAIELDPARRATLTRLKEEGIYEAVHVGNVLDLSLRAFDCAIGNPPFGDALPIVRRLCRHIPRVILLLPLAFLASQGRAAWWQQDAPPCCVNIIPFRPSFIGGDTIKSDVAWFDWWAGWGANRFVIL